MSTQSHCSINYNSSIYLFHQLHYSHTLHPFVRTSKESPEKGGRGSNFIHYAPTPLIPLYKKFHLSPPSCSKPMIENYDRIILPNRFLTVVSIDRLMLLHKYPKPPITFIPLLPPPQMNSLTYSMSPTFCF